MSQLVEANIEEKYFKWGNKIVGQNNKVQLYESFTYGSVEYFLYDCVYFYQTGDFETSIGKLVGIYETSGHEKKVRVVWFLRPIDIRNFLGGYQPHWNELFLACGEGTGVTNINLLEAIIGKCIVISNAKDKRNSEPSEAEIKMADFFFNYAFDVGKSKIVDEFPDHIGGVKVENFFNKVPRPRIVSKKRTSSLGVPNVKCEDKAEVKPQKVMANNTSSKSFPFKKRKILEDNVFTRDMDFGDNKKKKICEDAPEPKSDKVVKTCGEFMEFTKRPGNVKLYADNKSFGDNKKKKICEDAPEPKSDKVVKTCGEFMEFTKRPGNVKLYADNKSFGDNKKKKICEDAPGPKSDKVVKTCGEFMEVTKRPGDVKLYADNKNFGDNKKKKICEDAPKPKSNKVVKTCGEFMEVTKRPGDVKLYADNKNFGDNKKKKICEDAPELKSDKVVKTCGEFMEVTKRLGDEKRKWFKPMPWEERLSKAQEQGSLVLLNNLDPSYTSYEVEDLVWHALKEKVEARMIEWSLTFNPHYGRAFVIFKTKDAAESAITRLNRRCLILGDGRAVTAMKGTYREPVKQTNFVGHLTIDRYRPHRNREEMRKAVSTSHCSQPNTVEYAMACDWRYLQDKCDAWWNALYKKQTEQIQRVKERLKMKSNF